MAPLPANNTDVLFLDYTTGRREHTMQLRFAAGGLGVAETVLGEFLDALQLVLVNTWRVLGGRVRLEGSNITLPTTLSSNLVNFEGGSNTPLGEVNEPREWVWSGRGAATGRRVDISVYGIVIDTPASYRYLHASAAPSLGAARGVLESELLAPISIGGDRAIWYGYTNVNYNSYWETRARRSS